MDNLQPINNLRTTKQTLTDIDEGDLFNVFHEFESNVQVLCLLGKETWLHAVPGGWGVRRRGREGEGRGRRGEGRREEREEEGGGEEGGDGEKEKRRVSMLSENCVQTTLWIY